MTSLLISCTLFTVTLSAAKVVKNYFYKFGHDDPKYTQLGEKGGIISLFDRDTYEKLLTPPNSIIHYVRVTVHGFNVFDQPSSVTFNNRTSTVNINYSLLKSLIGSRSYALIYRGIKGKRRSRLRKFDKFRIRYL